GVVADGDPLTIGTGAIARRAVDLHVGQHLDAALLEGPHDDVGGVLVDAGQDLGQRLEDGDLAADVAQEGGELAADGTAADDRHPGRHVVEIENVIGVHDPFAVDLNARKAAGARPGGEDQRLGAGDLGSVIDAQGLGGGVYHRA